MSLTPIDLSRLPLPDAVEQLNFEDILADISRVMILLAPEAEDELSLESSFLTKLAQVFAARELLMRARANDSVRAVMLATATGGDLDNLVALFGVERQVIVAADPDAVPPVEALMEADTALRRRAQLAPEGFTNAGTVGSYTYHALSADSRVRDAGITRPSAGSVRVTILSREDDGVPSAGLLATVAAVIEEMRPLCDDTAIAAPDFTDFSIEATLQLTGTPGAEVVVASARSAVEAYLDEAFAVGRVIRRSALVARLHQPGVENVVLSAPVNDIDPGATGVARPTGTMIAYEVIQ